MFSPMNHPWLHKDGKYSFSMGQKRTGDLCGEIRQSANMHPPSPLIRISGR
jgi:hypothetical protein